MCNRFPPQMAWSGIYFYFLYLICFVFHPSFSKNFMPFQNNHTLNFPYYPVVNKSGEYRVYFAKQNDEFERERVHSICFWIPNFKRLSRERKKKQLVQMRNEGILQIYVKKVVHWVSNNALFRWPTCAGREGTAAVLGAEGGDSKCGGSRPGP